MIHSVRYPSAPGVDLALLSTDFSLDHYMSAEVTIVGFTDKVDAIVVGGHLDDWIGKEFVLEPVVLFGFPPVPTSRQAELVAASGEVNAVIDRYSAEHVHFVVSPTARGGFSGGPVLLANGQLLGVVTESLTRGPEDVEPGFATALSVEPIYNILADHCVAPRANRLTCYMFGWDEGERQMYDDLLTVEERAAFDLTTTTQPTRQVPTSMGGAKRSDCG